MTYKLNVSMAYFCTNVIIIMQLSFVRQGWCFPTYFPKFFLKSFQRSFENAHFPNIFLGRSSIFIEDLPKKLLICGSFPRKRNLPKIFVRSFENVAAGSQRTCIVVGARLFSRGRCTDVVNSLI